MSIFWRAAGLSYLQRLPASSVATHFIAKNIATKQPRSFSLKFKLFNGIDNIAIARQRQYHVLNRTKKFHTSLQMNTKKKISSIIVRNNNNSNIFKQQKKTFVTRTKSRRQASSAEEKSGENIFHVKKPKTFQEMAQVDTLVVAGVVIAGGAGYLAYGTTQEEKKDYLVQVLYKLRALGINKSNLDDEKLANMFMKCIEGAANNVMASPLFYTAWHLIHRQSLPVSIVRGITGTLRIAPFMALFYFFAGIVVPYSTNHFMNTGKDFDTAYNYSFYTLTLALSILEVVVELVGCGVAFKQMSVAPLLVFYPALIGRIASGVLLQIEKTGEEFQNILSKDFNAENAPAWQRKLYELFDTLAIDQSFFITLFGTAFFQHVLNGVTFVLLTFGRKGKISDIGSYIREGGVGQFIKTIGMRFSFVLGWNWLSSREQKRGYIQLAVEELKKKDDLEDKN
jgi:hypothetical protein